MDTTNLPPSLSEDVARVVGRLNAIDEETMYDSPASSEKTIREAAALIQALSSQLAEARAKGNDWSLEADKYKRALDRKVNEKIAEVQARKAAEADRDRLAAEIERKVEALEAICDAIAKGLTENDLEHHRIKLTDGTWLEGQAATDWRNMLVAFRDILRALAEQEGRDDE